MSKQYKSLVAMVLLGVALFSTVSRADEDAAQFFSGKTIQLILGTGAGGAYGAYAILFSKYFSKHIPGNPSVIPEFRPGAGGVTAANYLYNAALKDGTMLGMPMAPIVLAQLTAPSIQYDAAKFNWIGQLAGLTRLIAVWNTSPVKTFDDLKTHETIAGDSGRGSETYINPAVINSLFGTKIKLVGGYDGSNGVMLALERGEISLASGTWANFAENHPDWISNHKVRFLVQIGSRKLPGYEDLPLLSDLAKNDDDRQVVEFMSLITQSVGYSIMAPPGVPSDRVAVLRTAFDAAVKDPDFLASAHKCCVDLAPEPYTTVEQAVKKAVNSPKAVLDRFMRASNP
jgi:tripartite-type tricarboxylate transporter receptor subunit TctC